MNKIVVLLLLYLVSLSAFSNGGQKTEVTSKSDSVGIGISQSGAQASPTINFGGSTSPVFLPNSAASVVPNVNQFVKSGPGLAEKTSAWGKFFMKVCAPRVYGSEGTLSRAEPVQMETDYANMLWQPYPDASQVNIPAERKLPGLFTEPVTDIENELGQMNPKLTHYCLGQITIRTPRDEDIQDLITQETLLSEAIGFASQQIRGFAHIIPVFIPETNAYYEDTAASGTGISVTPQASGVPAVGVGVASMFTWQKNHGIVGPTYGMGMKLIFLAQASNQYTGHPIVARIQQQISLAKAQQIELQKEMEEKELRMNRGEKGIQSFGSATHQ